MHLRETCSIEPNRVQGIALEEARYRGTKIIQQSNTMKTRILLASFLAIGACTTLQSLQNYPGVQAAETAGIGIGLEAATGSPAFSFVAPIAVSGLTALANGSNPTAVTGVVSQDVPLITSTVSAAIPNSTGTVVATKIAQAYATAMASGVPQTPTGANAVIAAIASGLTTGATKAGTLPSQASAPPFPRMDRYPNRAPDSFYNFLPPMEHLTFASNPEFITIRP